MKRTAKLLAVAAAVIVLFGGGYLLARAYLQAVMAGKTVWEGSATIVELRNLNCEEAKRDALDESVKSAPCWPDERVLRAYLRVDDFHGLDTRNNALLLRAERQNEARGIWRCRDHQFYLHDVPNRKVGDQETFQFQFLPSLWNLGGSPLIYLTSCKR